VTLQVFVSYKSEYRDFARKVRDQLRGWGYETWFDMDNIPKGAYFRHAIQEGLDTSDVLVSVITPEAQNSREVMAEVDYFLSQNKPLVPLKRGDFKLLYIFITIQYIDFTRDEAEAFADLHKRLAELAAAESPAAPPTEEALAEPEPADGKKADELPLPAAPPAANQPQRQPSPTPIQQPIYHEPVKRKAAFTRYLLPAVAATALVSVGVLALVSSLGSPNISMTESPQFQWWIPLLAVVAVGGLALWWRWGRRSSRLEQTVLDDSNRVRMLDKVYDFWVVGVLENALQESGAFEVGLAAAPGAVLRHKDYGDYPLPPNAKIIDIFNDLNRELLILGAPGAGKTILLLQLAKGLIEAARGEKQSAVSGQLSANAQKAIPAVFNLSSWAAERKPLNEWIVEELRLRYQVPKKVAEMWVDEQALLLLLDGLDEVAEPYRDACVDAINAFREEYPAVDIAVCSRIADYEMLTRKLDLRGAVTLQPLNNDQIDGYLNRPELNGLRQVMSEDSVLREMATTPFLLNAMAYAYQGLGADALRLPDEGIESRRTRLLNVWVEKRLAGQHRAERVRHYLEWLAGKMMKFKQTVFYIEGLQLDWINKKTIQLGIRAFISITAGVLFAIFFSVWLNLIDLESSEVIFIIGTAVCLGIFLYPQVYAAEAIRWSFSWYGLLFGIFIGGLAAIANIVFTDVSQYYTFSQGSYSDNLANNLLIILSVYLGVTIGITVGLVLGILFGLRRIETIALRTQSNQGIKLSGYNAIRISFLFVLVFEIAFIILYASFYVFVPLIIQQLTSNWGFGQFLRTGGRGWIQEFNELVLKFNTSNLSPLISDFLIISPILGATMGLLLGGGASVIKHLELRILFYLSYNVPWNYAQFLDTCAKIGLLRKVGGGYIFAHRYLLEYFAGVEANGNS